MVLLNIKIVAWGLAHKQRAGFQTVQLELEQTNVGHKSLYLGQQGEQQLTSLQTWGGEGVEIILRSIEGMQSHRCLVTSLLACAVGFGVQESQFASLRTLGNETHRFL